MFRTEDGGTRQNIEIEDLAGIVSAGEGLLWLDISDEALEKSRAILRDVFAFHPLAIDDALEEMHVPKVDDWGDYLYMVLQAVDFKREDEDPIVTIELDIFTGRGYIVTYHTKEIPAIERIWDVSQRDERTLRKGAGRLLYRLLDDLVADYMTVVEGVDYAVDSIEDRVFEDPDASLLGEIFTLKRATLSMRRILLHQREVLNKLARGDFPLFDEEDNVFFRDIYDHLVRLYDIMEGMRDLVSGALDTYLSVVSNRMNEVMKTLTIITTLFMPMAFITGLFGMNFFQPETPVLTSDPVFILVLGITVLIPVGMYFWMRSRAWA
jgi:magnesium transporter